MNGLMAVLEKEFADNFGSRRFLLLFSIICLAGLFATYVAVQSMKPGVTTGTAVSVDFVFLKLFTETSENSNLPNFIAFINFLGPLVGIALGFDAINSERANGTLSRVLSQPVYRDAVINGKFLARVATIGVMLLSIVLIVSGLGLRLIGIPPTFDEVMRIVAFVVISVVYVAFWMSLAILFSILFRQTATAALAAIGAWIFFTFFMPMIAGLVASALVPVTPEMATTNPMLVIKNYEVQSAVSKLSPNTLFGEAIIPVLMPQVRTLGLLLPWETTGMLPTPLSFVQSLMVVWPQLIGLIAEALICFAISYIRFMREEIRSS